MNLMVVGLEYILTSLIDNILIVSCDSPIQCIHWWKPCDCL